jgi:hypothetical protein
MIVNLTQHLATPEQVADGVVDLPQAEREKLCELLTFNAPPTYEELFDRAASVIELSKMVFPYADTVMIGGATFFMAPLERAFAHEAGIETVYSFSRRESVDQPQADGNVKKVTVFRHVGWV